MFGFRGVLCVAGDLPQFQVRFSRIGTEVERRFQSGCRGIRIAQFTQQSTKVDERFGRGRGEAASFSKADQGAARFRV
jgi:hypothetical protein